MMLSFISFSYDSRSVTSLLFEDELPLSFTYDKSELLVRQLIVYIGYSSVNRIYWRVLLLLILLLIININNTCFIIINTLIKRGTIIKSQTIYIKKMRGTIRSSIRRGFNYVIYSTYKQIHLSYTYYFNLKIPTRSQLLSSGLFPRSAEFIITSW